MNDFYHGPHIHVCVLIVPGEVVRLELVSQLFGALLLFLFGLFTLLPVCSGRDVQQRLAGQDLPARTHTHTYVKLGFGQNVTT